MLRCWQSSVRRVGKSGNRASDEGSTLVVGALPCGSVFTLRPAQALLDVVHVEESGSDEDRQPPLPAGIDRMSDGRGVAFIHRLVAHPVDVFPSMGPSLGIVLVGSADAARLRAWYDAAFGGVPEGVVIDERDLAQRAGEPGRVILTFAVDDIVAAEARLIDHEVTWIREIEPTPFGRIGTVIDADGNYVQILQPTREHGEVDV